MSWSIFRFYISPSTSSSYRRIFRITTINHGSYYFATASRPNPSSFLFRPDKLEIVDEVESKLERGETKYRRHPGIFHLPVQRVEKSVQTSIGRALSDAPSSSSSLAWYKSEGIRLERHLQNRRLPVEPHDVLQLRSNIERRIREKAAKKRANRQQEELSGEEKSKFEEQIKEKCERRLKTSLYNWAPMKYDTRSACMTYCVLRFAPEYATIRRVFHEMAKRLPEFSPRHVLDFGSGCGTTFFAAQSIWSSAEKQVEEYVCVEPNENMVDLFHLLLRGGRIGEKGRQEAEQNVSHRNVTFRQFLPATAEREYDLVVSAYSLFELSSYEERMRVVANLWMKTKHFLVLIERGTNAGFRAIVEARDYLLAGGHEIYRNALSDRLANSNSDLIQVELILKRKDLTESEKFRTLRDRYPDVDFPTLLPHGHVFSPCPHDIGCPRLLMDVTPCNFPVDYFPLRLSGGEEVVKRELFSYIVLRKGYRQEGAEPSADWPRIVREPRRSKSCVWCQLCTKHGVLEDNPFIKGPTSTERGMLYRLASKSEWGDRLPVISTYGGQNQDQGDGGNDQQAILDEDDGDQFESNDRSPISDNSKQQ